MISIQPVACKKVSNDLGSVNGVPFFTALNIAIYCNLDLAEKVAINDISNPNSNMENPDALMTQMDACLRLKAITDQLAWDYAIV